MNGSLVLGIDPGLSNTGYAVAIVSSTTGCIQSVVEIGLITTEQVKTKVVRRTSDHLRRATEQANRLRAVLDRFPVDFIALEISTTTPYPKSTFSFGVMVGVVASFGLPIVQVLPREVKFAATGDDRATKKGIAQWALKLPGASTLGWPVSRRANKLGLNFADGHLAAAAEHPADALAAIQAAITSDQFQLARNLVSRGRKSDAGMFALSNSGKAAAQKARR